MRWLSSRFSDTSAILLYHRVDEPVADPFGLCVSPSHFEEQMAGLRDIGQPLPLLELLDQHRDGTLPPSSIGVTFDDGYLDVLENALPILEKFDIPATVFVVSGNIGEPFWWDRLIDLTHNTPQLPDSIRACETTISTAGISRKNLLKRLYPILQGLNEIDRSAALAALGACFKRDQLITTRRAMNADELRTLAGHPLITIGAHTVTHTRLANLSLEDQQREIETSLRQVEAIIDQPVVTFSYPFGLRSRDYNHDTVEAARRAGLDHAIAADLSPLTPNSDRFAVPRIWAHDIGGDASRKKIEAWL